MRLIPGFPTLRRDRLAVVFVAVALVQFGLIALGVWGTISYREALARRAESFQNVSAIDSLLVAVLNAETRQRGYVISGDSTYLAPYLEGRTAVGGEFSTVLIINEVEPSRSLISTTSRGHSGCTSICIPG